jgi:hypothetical protein
MTPSSIRLNVMLIDFFEKCLYLMEQKKMVRGIIIIIFIYLITYSHMCLLK